MKALLVFIMMFIIVFPVQSQQRVKDNIDDLREKIIQLQKSIADIRNSTDNISKASSTIKNKTGFLTGDYFSGELLQTVTDLSVELKDKINTQHKKLIQFSGPGNQCNPGTECYKFKKDLVNLLDGIKSLNNTLRNTQGNNLEINDKLKYHIENGSNVGLLITHEALGPMISTLSQKINELSVNMNLIVADLYSLNTVQQGAPSGIRGRGPEIELFAIDPEDGIISKSSRNAVYQKTDVLSELRDKSNFIPEPGFNSEITTIQLSDFCKKDRSAMAKFETSVEVGVVIIKTFGSLLQELPEVEVAAGGSFVGHAAVHFKANIPKLVGVLIENAGEVGNIFLDRWKDALDDCETQRSQKIVLDNQKILLENMALLFDELNKLKAK